MSPFDFVKQILQGKKQLIVDDVTEKEAALKADIVLQRTPTTVSGQPTSWAS